MELYGRNPGRDGSQSDAQMEWGPTGLEEPMMRLELRSRELYPERPGVPDCIYYMRIGFCGFGSRCRYNHPLDRNASCKGKIEERKRKFWWRQIHHMG